MEAWLTPRNTPLRTFVYLDERGRYALKGEGMGLNRAEPQKFESAGVPPLAVGAWR